MLGFSQNPYQLLAQIQVQLNQVQARLQQAIQWRRYDVVQQLQPTYFALHQQYTALLQQLAQQAGNYAYGQHQPVHNSGCMSVQDSMDMMTMKHMGQNHAQISHFTKIAANPASSDSEKFQAMQKAKRCADSIQQMSSLNDFYHQSFNQTMNNMLQSR